jgi:hypothetical protein
VVRTIGDCDGGVQRDEATNPEDSTRLLREVRGVAGWPALKAGGQELRVASDGLAGKAGVPSGELAGRAGVHQPEAGVTGDE